MCLLFLAFFLWLILFFIILLLFMGAKKQSSVVWSTCLVHETHNLTVFFLSSIMSVAFFGMGQLKKGCLRSSHFKHTLTPRQFCNVWFVFMKSHSQHCCIVRSTSVFLCCCKICIQPMFWFSICLFGWMTSEKNGTKNNVNNSILQTTPPRDTIYCVSKCNFTELPMAGTGWSTMPPRSPVYK